VKKFLPIVLTCILMVSGVAANSEDRKIAGSDAPEYNKAVSQWLDGEDKAALISLAELARQDNRAAQILLASIAVNGNLHAHVTSKLSRNERIALLRIPEGLSGKSWLTAAEQSEPLATALLQARKIGSKAPAIRTLIEFGEMQTALIAAQSMLYQGEANALIAALQGLENRLPAEAEVILAWARNQSADSTQGSYAGSARIGTLQFADLQYATSELAWEAPSPGQVIDGSDWYQAAIDNAENITSWRPIRNLCEKSCAETVNNCTVTGASLLWQAGPFPMRSPIEALIPNDQYWQSARIEADITRKIPNLNRFENSLDGNMNACFVRTMQKLHEKFGRAKG